MLLSYKFKIPGFIFISAGFLLAILYFIIDFRFEMPVFAVASSYMESRFFTSFRTNFADELIMLILIAGFTSVAFSKEKHESDHLKAVRTIALRKTAIVNTAILAFSVLFIYGGGFIAILIVNIFMPYLIYLILFYTLKKRTGEIHIG